MKPPNLKNTICACVARRRVFQAIFIFPDRPGVLKLLKIILSFSCIDTAQEAL